MKCLTKATKVGNRWLHVCVKCGRSHLFKSPDPSKVSMECGIVGELPGVGTLLRGIFSEMTIVPVKKCGCAKIAQEMDTEGPDWCMAHRHELATRIYEKSSISEWIQAFASLPTNIQSGLAFRINPLNPVVSLIEEAVRRYETLVLG